MLFRPFGRHLGGYLAFDLEDEAALVRLARHQHGPIVAAGEKALVTIEAEAAVGVCGRVALDAVASEEGPDLFGVAGRLLGRRGHGNQQQGG